MLQESEITIIGSGLVGLSLAVDLIKQGRSVTLVGKASPELPHPANRVVALNKASKEFLTALGAWELITSDSITPYYQMCVWEKDANGELAFKNTDVNQEQLGYIVVNSELEKALWQAIELATSQYPEAKFNYIASQVIGYQELQQRHFLTLEDGTQLLCTFMVAADGGKSYIRNALNIGINRSEYSQTAITCVLELLEPHQNTCYQSFHQNGILAYLPLANPHQVSIVWSLNNDIIDQVLAYDSETFVQQVYACFHKGLGVPKLISSPTVFPLAKQYAQEVHGHNYALIGDAAHTIHPLAGQGVNLGFADAWQLADLIRNYYRPTNGIESSKLASWARRRKAKAFLTAETMSLIKNSFCNKQQPLKALRNLALNTINKIDFAKKQLINKALGYDEELYSLASYRSTSDIEKQEQANLQAKEIVINNLQNFVQKGANKILEQLTKK